MNYLSNRREVRVKEAYQRQWKRNQRSDEEQLAHLDFILGKGEGAKKERAKLLARIQAKRGKK